MTKFRKQLKVDKSLFRAVRNGLDGKHTRPAFNGIHVASDASRLTLTTTNGAMCMIGTQIWTGEDDSDNWGDLPAKGVILPNRTCRRVKKGKPGDIIEIEINSLENGAGNFEILDGRYTSYSDVLTDYPFPPVQQVMPRSFAPQDEFGLGGEVLARLSAAGKEFARAYTRLRFEAPDESEDGIPKNKIMVDYYRISEGRFELELQAFAMPVR